MLLLNCKFAIWTVLWYGGIHISRSAHTINLKISENVLDLNEGAMNQNEPIQQNNCDRIFEIFGGKRWIRSICAKKILNIEIDASVHL